MRTQYYCQFEGRRAKLREAASPHLLNGIDYLEVEEGEKQLKVHFVHSLDLVPFAPLTRENLEVRGGERIRDPKVVGDVRASGNVLTVEVDAPGDFSTYVLRLVASRTEDSPPAQIDPALSEVRFSFKADCPSDFDCRPALECPVEEAKAPPIDYLAKDYASFRRLMLDRIAVLVPRWNERNPADVLVALTELIAHRGDELSYFQDAVAGEAYLGTARKRVSIRRHCRLLDYPFHDGRNARAWVAIEIDEGADGRMVPGPRPDARTPGALFITKGDGETGAIVSEKRAALALNEGVEPFEAMHDLALYSAHNEIRFHTWSDEVCCLPKGATAAFLRDDDPPRLRLRRGDVLVFEEKKNPANDVEADADRTRRYAVRLTRVGPDVRTMSPPETAAVDEVTGVPVVEIEWGAEDALPFSFQVSSRVDGRLIEDVSVARGNVVLADHGLTPLSQGTGDNYEELDEVPANGRYRPTLERGPLTQQAYVLRGRDRAPVLVDEDASAAAAFAQEPIEIRPALDLRARGDARWAARNDLLASGRFDAEFVAETLDDGKVQLRFGDDVHARRPSRSDSFTAVYRTGNGLAGNVGSDSIAHLVVTSDLRWAEKGVTKIRNPLAAAGGADPHPIRQAKLYAPAAFRRQERAVTAADYAATAERHPEVQRAVATRRWTGSWHTMFVTVDRRAGQPVDAGFEAKLRAFLERFRLAGHDVEIESPRFVSLDIALGICTQPGYFPADVKQELAKAFGSRVSAGGGRGLFHPDNFTFGDAVYLSRIVARAVEVPGVARVLPLRFQRWGNVPADELEKGAIPMGRLEIARLDSDPNAPENGRIEFEMLGQS